MADPTRPDPSHKKLTQTHHYRIHKLKSWNQISTLAEEKREDCLVMIPQEPIMEEGKLSIGLGHKSIDGICKLWTNTILNRDCIRTLLKKSIYPKHFFNEPPADRFPTYLRPELGIK